MRRITASLIVLAALARPLLAQTIPVALGGQRSSMVGLPFAVPITVDMSARTDKLGAFAARMTWNPAVLQLKSGADGTFGSVTVNEDSLASGVLRITGVNPAGVGGLVTVGVGTFVPLTADTTTFSLQLTELYAAGTFADLLPSASVGGVAVYCPARGRFGDINGDGNVNSADALIALTSVVGLPTGGFDVTLGDVDNTGSTTARDALIMLSAAVGLDVSGFRIGIVAGGSCAAFANLTMAVLPGSFTMLVGQQARLEARAADSTGALQSLTDLVWRSNQPGVVGVLADGTAIARDTGTATVVAVHGADSAAALIRVDSNRTVQVVDAQAVTAHVQLGSAAYPFATIAQAMVAARAGDTVRIRPGAYQEAVTLDRDVRLLGDTLADGSRPVITNPVGDGIHLVNAGYREVKNIAFGTANDAVNVDGPASVLLSGLVGHGLPSGIIISRGSPVVRLADSRLDGTGANLCCSYYGIDASYGPVDSIIIDRSDLGDFYNSGIYAPYGGTFVIRNSRLHDFGSYGLELGGNSGPGVRLLVDGSYLARSSYELLSIADVVAASITHSVLAPNPNEQAIYQYQENIPAGGFIALVGDSLAVNYADWLYANDLDSVTIDSLRADIPQASGNLYNVNYVRVAHSTFTNASGDAFYVDNYNAGGVMELRRVAFTGDPRNDLRGYPVYAYNMRTTVDSSSFDNASTAVEVDGDSSMSVTNSSFHHVEYPVYYDGNYYPGCTGTGCPSATVGALVRNNTFAGYYTAIDVEYGAAVADSNTLSGNDQNGIYVYQPSTATVAHNVVAGDRYAIEVDMQDTSTTARIVGNVVTGATYTGIYAQTSSYPDSVHGRFEITGNQVDCVPGGSTYGVRLYGSDGLVSGNQFTGCGTGVYLQSGTATARADSVYGNTIRLPLASGGGVTAFDNLRARVIGNTILAPTSTVGATMSYEPIYASSYYYPSGTALFADSNAVLGGLNGVVSAFDIDTAVVTRNVIDSAQSSQYAGAIELGGGIHARGLVAGNVVRHALNVGIMAANNDTATIVVDSNMVSNAGWDGIQVYAGLAQLTRNTLTGNRYSGIHVSYGLLPAIDSNNISGNAFGLRVDGPGVSAANNWWGDASGPACAGDSTCIANLGDSVSTSATTYTVAWQPALGLPVGSAPPPSAPRVFALARLAAPRTLLRAIPAPDAMPAAPATRPMRTLARPAYPVRQAAAGAASASLAQRAARVARMNERASRAAARLAERTAAIQARLTARAARPAPAQPSDHPNGPMERRP